MVEIWQITKGPNTGMWAWKINAPQKRIQSQWNKVWGKRSGIALNESKARSTAKRQLLWHTREALASQERMAA